MFQLLGDDDTAADCFHQFLESTERFRPSDVDAALLKQRDIALAIRTATKKLELASKNPSR
jgi:hypothetical protein